MYDVVKSCTLAAAGRPAQHDALLGVGCQHLEVGLLSRLVEVGRHLVVVHVPKHRHHLQITGLITYIRLWKHLFPDLNVIQTIYI